MTMFENAGQFRPQLDADDRALIDAYLADKGATVCPPCKHTLWPSGVVDAVAVDRGVFKKADVKARAKGREKAAHRMAARKMREAGKGYDEIAKSVGITKDAAYRFCRDIDVDVLPTNVAAARAKAEKAREMHLSGHDLGDIASALNASVDTVKRYVRGIKSARLIASKVGVEDRRKRAIAMRKGGMQLADIGAALGVHWATAAAYCREAKVVSVAETRRAELREKALKMRQAGMRVVDIAAQLGISEDIASRYTKGASAYLPQTEGESNGAVGSCGE